MRHGSSVFRAPQDVVCAGANLGLAILAGLIIRKKL